MMRICIISWDDEARRLYQLLRSSYEIEYIIERDNNQWGTLDNGLKIVSFSKAYKLFREGMFDVFLIPAMRGINVNNGIYLRLLRNNIPQDKIWYAPLASWKCTDLDESERIGMLCPFNERKELDYLALHIADHCNLNCSYCSVFSGLVKQPSFPDTESTLEGIRLLRKYYDQVLVFRLLGGEPLLNKDWLKIALYARELFPLADIEVVTNGLKILQLTKEEFSVMRENGIAFDISYYPVIGDKIDDINELLRENNVKHYITQENEFFSRLYNFSHPGDTEQNYQVCKMKFMCLNMYGKRLGVCHALIGLERAKEFIPPEIADTIPGYWVDLDEDGLSARKIREKLDRPMPICRYCNQDLALWHPLTDSSKVNDPGNWSLL